MIIAFWEAVESFTTEQQRELLKFVTACSRAPLLGFRCGRWRWGRSCGGAVTGDRV